MPTTCTRRVQGAPGRPGRPGPETGSARGWTLAAASLGFGVVQLDVSVVNVAINPIGAELGAGVGALQWVVNAYTVAFAALILTAGALGDRIGAITLTALAAATIEGGSHGFATPPVLGGFALAALAAVAFVLTETRRARPMLPLRLFRSATFSSSTVIGLCVNIAFYGLIFVFSLFFQRQQHLSALRTGLAFAPMTAAIMAANVTAGRLARVLGARQIIAAGALLMVAGSAALLGMSPATGYWLLVTQLVALGFGLGMVVPAMTAALLGSVDRSRSGVASGTLNTARQTGSVIGVSLFGALIAGGRYVTGLHVALVIAAALGLLAAGLAGVAGRGARRAESG